MSGLTLRQMGALGRIIRQAEEHFGVEIRGIEDFTFHYEEEYRPGRGHRVRFNYADGDHVVSGFMDVYGDYSLSIGEVDWLHNDGDEECGCSLCGSVAS